MSKTLTSRLLVAAIAALTALGASIGSASASTGTQAQAHTISTPNALVPCTNTLGHYCAKVFFNSVSGGLKVTETESTGYTYGAGKAREWFRYSCTLGKCYTAPSAIFSYGTSDVQLNVKRVFSGSGFFLPCGNVFGVDYRNPATNAPGPGPVLFKVVCTRSGAAPTRI
jgi:hypothetical protein